jgi:hypothetical protein
MKRLKGWEAEEGCGVVGVRRSAEEIGYVYIAAYRSFSI